MRYVEARFQREYRDMAYRIYVTDSLQALPQNKFFRQRFYDMINVKKDKELTGDELALEVIKKCGLILEVE